MRSSKLAADTALIDGEVVVEKNGVSDFSSLQDALKNKKDSFVYYVFDLLHLDGTDLTGEPLTERKAALKQLLKNAATTASSATAITSRSPARR